MADPTIEQDARPGAEADRASPGPSEWGMLIALTALGALARLYRLDAQSLWMDETFSYRAVLAMKDQGPLVVARLDHTAPAAYWMSWLSMGIGGASDFWFRLPMALVGTLTVPMIFALGRRLFGSTSIGLGAAAVAAVSPFAVWYAQEARMYAPLILMAAIYVYECWPAAEGRPGPLGWLAMAAATAVGLYVHQYVALLSATFGLYLLARLGLRDRRVWLWTATQVAGALAFVPWLVLSARHLGNSAGTEKPMPILWIPYTYFTFVAGFSLGPTVRDLRLEGVSSALREHAGAIALVGLSASAAGLAGARRLLRSGDRWAGAWCLAWAVGPVALAVAMTRFTSISYNARYASACFPAVALVLGAAVASARRSPMAALGVAGVLAAMGWSLWNWYESPHYAKEDLRDAATYLADALAPEDVMVIANSRSILTLDRYGFPCPPGAVVAGDPSEVAGAVEAIDRLAEGPPRRAWLLEYREWETDSGRQNPSPD